MALVRKASEDDWFRLRAVRLAALAESPSVFASTLAREQAFGEDDWREWPRTSAVFLAFVDATEVGMVAGFDGEMPHERRLVALWVDPSHRRHGIADDLMASVEDWARQLGATLLTLWVANGNEPARRLYLRRGFTASGVVQPLPSNPDVIEEQLVLRLRPDRPSTRAGRPGT